MSATADYWCEQAWIGEGCVTDDVVLTVVDGRISAVTAGVPSPSPRATRLDGLTLPGFANTHSHAFHRALRGRTHTEGGTFWTWREQMYRLAAVLDPDLYEELATAVYAEMVLAGFTCVGEFHYLHHGPDGVAYTDRNEIGTRLVAAAARAGIRLTLLDTCYLTGGVDRPLAGVQRRFGDGGAGQWVERVDSLREAPAVRLGAAVHSVRAVAPADSAVVVAWAHERGRVLHAHVSEQPQENADSVAAFGRTPTGVLADAGALDHRFTAIHATHLSEADVAALASAHARVCICPTTERELADGIGPTAALRAAGVALCVGSDSHAVIDPFEEARAVELDERLTSLRRGTHSPAELVGAVTANGYASVGWPEGGRLADGALADFVTVSFDSVRLAGSDRGGDALGAALFAAAASDVTDVVIGGRHVVSRSVHQDLDVAAALESAISAVWKAM